MNRQSSMKEILSHIRDKDIFLVIRILLGIYIGISWVFYNTYTLITYQNGFRIFLQSDLFIYGIVIIGSILCVCCRIFLYYLEHMKEKKVLFKYILFVYQIACCCLLAVLLVKVYGCTKGRVNWYCIRVYLEFVYTLLWFTILQFSGYILIVAVGKFLDRVKTEKKKVTLVIAFIIAIIIGLTLFRLAWWHFSTELNYAIDDLAQTDLYVFML